MRQNISAGGFVIQDDKLLLVNHKRENRYDFWVAPGGSVDGTETLDEAAIREVKEECGIDVTAGPLMYIEEFWQPELRTVKFWFLCHYQSGDVDTSAEEATREYIVDGKFMSREEISQHTVFPPVVNERLWDDIAKPIAAPIYLGLREMDFY